MFYSHEILTNRKYGVATIWLVATLGLSRLRKVNRKEILAVNLPKACDTVTNPEAPLALRLQSNLLVGISRVYLQQFEYLYHDVSNAHMSMKRLEMIDTANINIKPTREAHAEQLILPDDPRIHPDLLGLDLAELRDLLLDDIVDAREPELGADSLIFSTPAQQGSAAGSQRTPFGLGPGTSPSSVAGIGGFTPFQLSEINTDKALSPLRDLDSQLDRFEENPLFGFDADGNFRDNTPQLPPLLVGDESPTVAAKARKRKPGVGSHLDSDDIEEQVRREHEEGHQDAMEIDQPMGEDLVLPNMMDLMDLEEQLPVPNVEAEVEKEKEVTPVPAVRRARTKHVIVDNNSCVIVHDTLKAWNTGYAELMENNWEAKIENLKHRQNRLAIINRAIIGEVGPAFKSMFSTQAILDKFQASAANAGSQGEEENARSSQEGVQGEGEQEVGRSGDNQGAEVLPDAAGSDVELGRDAPLHREDVVSLHSGDHIISPGGGASSSSGMGGGFVARQSSSPLQLRTGRAGSRISVAGSILEVVEEVDESNLLMPDYVPDQFDFYGEARAAHEEINNEREISAFYDHIKKKLATEQAHREAELEEQIDHIVFQEIVKPDRSNRRLAAAAFHHTLVLATMGLIRLNQDAHFGEIRIGLV